MTGWRTKRRHIGKGNCPQEKRKPKTAANLLMSPKGRPQIIFLHPPVLVWHHQGESRPKIDRLVVLPQNKTTPVEFSGVSRINAYTAEQTGCRQQTASSCLNGQHLFPKCPKPRKCSKKGCSSPQITFFYGSERSFSQKRSKKTDETKKTTASKVNVITKKVYESPGMPPMPNLKGLFQIN